MENYKGEVLFLGLFLVKMKEKIYPLYLLRSATISSAKMI